MALKFSSTSDAGGNGLKILVYGEAGIGKTFLCSTAPHDETVIISAESGLLTLAHVDIKTVEITSFQDMLDAYTFIVNDPVGQAFKWVCIDSATEIAEQILSHELKNSADPRQAYGELTNSMTDLLKRFRDLPGRNVYISAKAEREKDDATGAMLWQPSMPGRKLGPQIPYLFDIVAPLRVVRSPDGESHRALLTSPDGQWVAKNRGGFLDQWEEPNLATIHDKIVNGLKKGES